MIFRISIWETWIAYLYTIIQMAMLWTMINSKTQHNGGLWLIFIIVQLVLYYGFGVHLNYVVVTANELQLKNAWLFWKKESYALSIVKSIEFSRVHKQGTMITVITKDHEIRGYVVQLLSNQKIRELRAHLEKLNIPVIQYVTFVD